MHHFCHFLRGAATNKLNRQPEPQPFACMKDVEQMFLHNLSQGNEELREIS